MPEGFPIDVDTLSVRRLARIVDAAAGHADQHPVIAGAFADFLDRYASKPGVKLRVEDLREGSRRKGIVVVADRHRLRELAQAGTLESMDRNVSGRLFEANLETGRAQIRTVFGKVDVSFDKELEPAIKRLLGDRAGLRGEATYDPRTNRLKSLRVREVLAGEQLALADYWHPKSLAELAIDRGSHPVADPADLVVNGATDEDWKSFFEAIGVAR